MKLSKTFFFEKKKQKTFVESGPSALHLPVMASAAKPSIFSVIKPRSRPHPRPSVIKNFLRSFFLKKRPLTSPSEAQP